jgi:D-alanine-D-alanine ligase
MNIVLIKSVTSKPWRSQETYQMIEDSLREKWNVESIMTNNALALQRDLSVLKQEYGDDVFVFNVAEYLDEDNKKGFLPGLLEEWHFPHLGSSADTIAIGLDKARTKELLVKNGIPTPRYFVAKSVDLVNSLLAEEIGYPLIVKPLREGGHIGITEDSVIFKAASLNKGIQRIIEDYQQPALVEEYIAGKEMREFSVGIIDCKPRLFTPVEIDYEAMDLEMDILSIEATEKDLERIKPVREELIRTKIIDLANKTFDAVKAWDYSRIDLRMDHTDCYILEINIMPGLGPHSFLPEAAKDIYGFEYNQLIQTLAEISINREPIFN